MAKNHYVTKPNRRNKNKRRKDYTRETMLKLRALDEAHMRRDAIALLGPEIVQMLEVTRNYATVKLFAKVSADEAII